MYYLRLCDIQNYVTNTMKLNYNKKIKLINKNFITFLSIYFIMNESPLNITIDTSQETSDGITSKIISIKKLLNVLNNDRTGF